LVRFNIPDCAVDIELPLCAFTFLMHDLAWAPVIAFAIKAHTAIARDVDSQGKAQCLGLASTIDGV
jgi:hypothetical protein